MSKKKILISIFLLSVLFMFPAQVLAFSGSGNGTFLDPYVITTPNQLKEMNNEKSARYVLGNDIDMDGVRFTGIGSSSSPFTGSFNGNGYTIKNLRIRELTTSNIGFINYMTGGSIAEVTIENAEIYGKNNVGILLGMGTEDVKIFYCNTSGIIYGDKCAGGIVGYVGDMLTMERSSSTADVVSGNIDNSSRVGGLVGYCAGDLAIDESFFAGTLQCTSVTRVGGLVGYCAGNTIVVQDCYVNTSYFTGKTDVGGIIGYNVTNARTLRIENSYVTGKFPTLKDSVHIIADYATEINNCYFNSTTTGVTYPSSQARTDSQMKNKSTFAGFNFDSVWEINSGSDYPVLRNNLPITYDAPSNLRGTAAVNSVTLNWNGVSGAKGYEITYETGTSSRTVTSTTNSVTVTGLSANTSYDFKVRVRHTGGAGKWTSPVTVKTLTALTAPQSFSIDTVTPTSIKLTWTAVPTATGYKINDGSKDITISNGSATSYTVTGLEPETLYGYRIMAVRNTEYSDYSGKRSVTTPNIGNISGLNYTTEEDKALITWNANTSAQQYIVSVDGVESTVTVNQYTLSNLAYNKDYKVKVQAKFNGYDGPWSDEITINRGPEPFIPPTGIQLSSKVIRLSEGDSDILSAIVLPENADDKELEFNIIPSSSTAISLETTGDNGSRKINGLNSGVVEIEVKLLNYNISETCIVEVKVRHIPVTDIIIDFDETMELTAGNEYPFRYKLEPLEATDTAVEISSSRPDILDIMDNGNLIAKKAGTATITVLHKKDNISKNITLTVVETAQEPTGIHFVMPEKIVIGKTYPVVFEVEPAGAEYEIREMRSTVPMFFDVIDGVVHPYTAGKAILMVTLDNGVRGTYPMEVIEPVVVDKIESRMERTTFTVGEEFEVLYEVLPEDAEDKDVIITVTNGLVLEKTSEKTVKAVGVGQGVIMVTSAANPGVKLVLQIKVESRSIPVESIQISPEQYIMTMYAGDAPIQLEVDFTPENATNKNLIFEDLIPGCINVTDDGIVTAISPGFTAIMITSEDNPYAMDFSNITVEGVSRMAAYHDSEIADYILNVGEQETLEFYGEYNFYSSNSDVINIQKGMINAVGRGYAAIIAMDESSVVSVYIVYVK